MNAEECIVGVTFRQAGKPNMEYVVARICSFGLKSSGQQHLCFLNRSKNASYLIRAESTV